MAVQWPWYSKAFVYKSIVIKNPHNHARRPQVIYVKAYQNGQQVILHRITPTEGAVLEVPGNSTPESLGLPADWQGVTMYVGPEAAQIPQGPVLMNAIADADIFPAELANLHKLLKQLKEHWPALRVLNWPEGIMKTRRDAIATAAQGMAGLVVPHTVRFTPASRADFMVHLKASGIGWPLLIRPAGKHNGSDILKLDSAADEALLDSFAFNGQNAYYATEFYDYKNNAGEYQKIRIVMIGGRPYLRHHIIGEEWNVHMSTRKNYMLNNPTRKETEEAFLARGMANFAPDVLTGLSQLHTHLGLDVFGIDGACLPNGRLLVFEVNAAMEFITQDTTAYPYLNPHIQAIQQAWHGVVGSANGDA